MTGNLKWMSDPATLEGPVQIKLGNSSTLECRSMGNVHMKAYDGVK